jgi:hypothetical protein
MKSKDGVKKSSKETYKAGYQNRIVKVKERLEAQLISKVKPGLIVTESGSSTWGNVPLTEADIKRINKELLTLKSR